MFADCGRPYNVNQAKIEFQLVDEPDRYELILFVYKSVYKCDKSAVFILIYFVLLPNRFMDTSLIDVDVQPNYVRATIKKKVFQMTLNDEVRTGMAKLQRSMVTGHLLIVMPKVKWSGPLISAEKTKPKGNAVFFSILSKS